MKKGQTLLEVIIATAIIGIGLVALLSLVVQSMSEGQQSKERTQATFLAQESIEEIHNIRDFNFKNNQHWLDNIQGLLGFNDGYYAWQGCCSSSDSYKYIGTEKKDDSDGWDSMNLEVDGIKFYRYIYLKMHNENKIEINVEVTWPRKYDDNPNGRVNLSSIITNWLSDEN